MKNIKASILWLLLLLSIIPSLYADDCSQSCKIADAPAPALTEYFTNIETLKGNILTALSKYESDNILPENNDSSSGSTRTSQVENEANRVWNSWKALIATFNSLLDFNDYFGSFDYKIALPITNEVPNEVKRDHRKLESINTTLTNILKTSKRRNSGWASIEKVCEWVSYCENLSVETVEGLLVEVIKSNRNITRLYEASILDKAYLADQRSFMFVSTDFEAQIEQYYNKDTLGLCSKCEWNSWSEMTETIKNISIKNGQYKEWMQKWRDAWALLRWGQWSRTSQAEEARVLTEYLWTQWISWSQADIVLDNLDRYWSWWVSGTNPLLNSSNYAQAGVENTVESFSETLRQQFEWRKVVPIVELTQVNSEVKWSEDLRLEIKSLYEDQLPFATSQDILSQEIQLRILRMHFSLVESINILSKNKSLAERICDKQWTGMWKCRY